MLWGLLRPLGACLGPRGTLLGLRWDPLGPLGIHGSDPWIRSTILEKNVEIVSGDVSGYVFVANVHLFGLRGDLFLTANALCLPVRIENPASKACGEDIKNLNISNLLCCLTTKTSGIQVSIQPIHSHQSRAHQTCSQPISS